MHLAADVPLLSFQISFHHGKPLAGDCFDPFVKTPWSVKVTGVSGPKGVGIGQLKHIVGVDVTLKALTEQ